MIKLHSSTDLQFYFTFCGKNGRVILTSETYPTRQHLDRAVLSVARLMTDWKAVKIKDLTKNKK